MTKLSVADNSRALATAAETALIEAAAKTWAEAQVIVLRVKKDELCAINKLRDVGIALREACGHEQMSFDWWQSRREKLADLGFKPARFCVHLANKFESPIKTIEEAKAARQMLFVALDEQAQSRRIEAQSSHERNPFSEFVSVVARADSLFADIGGSGMSEWGQDKLKLFVATVEPIAQKYQQAVELLKK
jgi:hypothetical protein